MKSCISYSWRTRGKWVWKKVFHPKAQCSMPCSEVKVKVTQSHPTLCDHPWNSLGQNTGVGSLSLHQGISQPRDPTQVSHIVGRFSTSWATRKAHVSLPFFPVHEKDCNNSISSRNYNNSPSMYSTFWLSHHSDTTISQARAFFIWSYKWRNSACENNILLDNHFPVCVNPFRKPPHKRQFSFSA